MPNFAERRFCAATAGLSAPPLISKRASIRTLGRKNNESRNIASAKATTRRAWRPTKSTDFRARKGRKRKGIVSGARDFENRHQSYISAGTIKLYHAGDT